MDKKTIITTIAIILSMGIIFALIVSFKVNKINKKGNETTGTAINKEENKEISNNEKEEKKVMNTEETKNVSISIKDYGTIKLELYPNIAPITVENFTKLVKEGFYDGLTFHRIIDGFMIQGGDPEGTGFGGSKETIKGEFKANGVNNNISHVRGVISMARSSGNYNSASSQFFIVQQDSDYLDGQYAGFGKVIEGMEIVDKICKDTPVEDNNGTVLKSNQPIIEKITIE